MMYFCSIRACVCACGELDIKALRYVDIIICTTFPRITQHVMDVVSNEGQFMGILGHATV